MKIKIMTAFLLAGSIILSQTIPSFMTIPDFDIVILIVIIVINKNQYSKTLIYGLFLGTLSALTTKSTNGQIPAFLCKVAVSQVVYLLMLILKNIQKEKLETIVLFTGLFLDSFIYFNIWFKINGILIFNNKFSFMLIIELILIITLSSFINTIIGKSMIKLINKCIEYDKTYSDNP